MDVKTRRPLRSTIGRGNPVHPSRWGENLTTVSRSVRNWSLGQVSDQPWRRDSAPLTSHGFPDRERCEDRPATRHCGVTLRTTPLRMIFLTCLRNPGQPGHITLLHTHAREKRQPHYHFVIRWFLPIMNHDEHLLSRCTLRSGRRVSGFHASGGAGVGRVGARARIRARRSCKKSARASEYLYYPRASSPRGSRCGGS